MDKPTIAHELGHAIVSYLYDTDSRPSSMNLRPDGSTKAWVNFDEWENLPVADYNLARLRGISYLGGLFGEILWHGKFNIFGIRTDIDEFLTELRFLGKEGSHRKSRSKLFSELWDWFYCDRDEWSFGGRMKAWKEGPGIHRGVFIHESRFKQRLPETYKIYCKFVKSINVDEFNKSVNHFHDKSSTIVRSRSLVAHARRIIPEHVMNVEDI